MGIKKLILSTLTLASLSTYADKKLVVTMFDNSTKNYNVESISEIEVSEKSFIVRNDKDSESFPIVDIRKIAFEEDNALRQNLEFKISIYPNPASDVLTIQGLEETWTKFLVITEIASGKSQEINVKDGNQVNVSALTPGVYLVVINGMPVFNFIKK